MNTEQRVAVVTGAGRGIGREYALALARAGFAVAVADLSQAGLLETVGLIEKEQGRAAAFVADVSDQASVQQLAADVRSEFGTAHVLVNNAALYHSIRLDSQMDVDIEYWRKMFAVNVEGVLLYPHRRRTAQHAPVGRGHRCYPVMRGKRLHGIHWWVRKWADLRGASPAVTCDGEVVTWSELDRRVDVLALHLDFLGVGAGDRVRLPHAELRRVHRGPARGLAGRCDLRTAQHPVHDG